MDVCIVFVKKSIQCRQYIIMFAVNYYYYNYYHRHRRTNDIFNYIEFMCSYNYKPFVKNDLFRIQYVLS
jgi:hypothetical protein